MFGMQLPAATTITPDLTLTASLPHSLAIHQVGANSAAGRIAGTASNIAIQFTMRLLTETPVYSNCSFASVAILRSFAVSVLIRGASTSGLPPIGTMPISAS